MANKFVVGVAVGIGVKWVAPYVLPVLGACTSPAGDSLVVSNYTRYGTLYDLLENRSVDITTDLVHCILRDVAEGLRYLHGLPGAKCGPDRLRGVVGGHPPVLVSRVDEDRLLPRHSGHHGGDLV